MPEFLLKVVEFPIIVDTKTQPLNLRWQLRWKSVIPTNVGNRIVAASSDSKLFSDMEVLEYTRDRGMFIPVYLESSTAPDLNFLEGHSLGTRT